MARPLIGITTDHDREATRHQLTRTYVDAVQAAGGEAVVLPYHHDADVGRLLGVVDGLLMTGGNDPDPAAWGEDWHPSCVPVDPRREVFERRLFDAAEERRTPVLGICLGMQLMGLRGGGTLDQFLPDVERADAIEHRKLTEADWQRRHPVVVTPASRLERICGPGPLEVNTNHRQALRIVGEGLVPVGHAPDGVIEAIEHEALPWIGVQWHPERLGSVGLFEWLVGEAST